MKLDKHIYLSKFPHSNREDYWINFENDPRLTKTKKAIYHKCLPCIQNLYYQLQKRRSEITLTTALSCWKIVVVLKSIDECLQFLQRFEREFLQGHIYGKLGSGRPKSDTRVVVFHAENKQERDKIYENIKICAPQVNPEAKIFISRACAVLYEEILGDWKEWKQTTPIKHTENLEKVLERIKRILFY